MWGSLLLKYITGSLFSDILNNVQKYWKFFAIIALIGLQAYIVHSWYDTNIDLVKEKISHQQDIKDFKNAQDLAATLAKTEVGQLKKENDSAVQKANQDYSNLLVQYRSSVLRYSSKSPTSEPSGGQLSTPQGSDGPSTSPSISITIDDANICAENTARIQVVHDWATNLMEK